MEKERLLNELKRRFGDRPFEAAELPGVVVLVIRPEGLVSLVRGLKEPPFSFDMLLDMTCVDDPAKAKRFTVVYHFSSLTTGARLRVKVPLGAADPAVDSLSPFWPNANWLEREIYDMFGVRFPGHPGLKRILLYEGFEGFPLRKDYPLRLRQPRLPEARET